MMVKKSAKPEKPARGSHKAKKKSVRYDRQQGKKGAKLSAADSKPAERSPNKLGTTPKAPPENHDTKSVDIAEFFALIAAGMVNAQRSLDDQSREYLKTMAAQPHALPSIFRIPKVSAEMKFATDTRKDEGFNLLFYKDQNSAEQLHQQTVQFDIVSAPPPPDLIAPSALASIVRLKSDRQAILKAVGALPAAVLNDFDRVIILEVIDTLQKAAPVAVTRQYSVWYADAAGNLGQWWLQIVTSTAAAVLAAVLPFGPVGAPLRSLQSFISSAGDHQKDFLAKLP
jgi:hypothetical protein